MSNRWYFKRLARLCIREAGLFLFLLGIIVFLQARAGAYSSGLAAHPDEAAHFVTSLLVRDYISQGATGPPLKYAEEFYAHYPRVAFGIWPPLFHIGLGAWMIPWGGDRNSAVVFMAFVAALWCYMLYRVARQSTRPALAFGAALVLAIAPATQDAASTVMADVTVALFMLCAMANYARFLDTEATKPAAWFGLFSAAAILTKYNGLAVAFVPPLAVLLTGRFYLVRRAAYWLPFGIVLLMAGPWYVLMRDWVLYAMEFGDLSPPGAGDAILAVFRQFGRGFGYVLAALGVLGAALHLWRRRPNWREEHAAGIRTSAIATALAVLLFHGLVYRLVETRYLLAVAPAMLLLALSAFDVRWELRSTPGASGFRRAAQVAAGVILIVIQCAPTFGTPAKAGRDYVRITDAILANEQGGEQRLLVSSDASGEGAIVAEIAMRDARPRHVVARASKILARRKLMGNEYQLLYRNPEDVNDLLRAYGIQVVALDDCSRRNCGQHHDIVSRAVQNGERWRRAASVTLQSGGAARIYVARLESPETSRKPMRIDMHYTLKREIAVE